MWRRELPRSRSLRGLSLADSKRVESAMGYILRHPGGFTPATTRGDAALDALIMSETMSGWFEVYRNDGKLMDRFAHGRRTFPAAPRQRQYSPRRPKAMAAGA